MSAGAVLRGHYKTLVDTDWLGQWDFRRKPDGSLPKPILTIVKVERYVSKRKLKGEKNKRIVIRFKDREKPWLAGPVSQKVIASLYGNDVGDWIGKNIQLYVDESVSFGGVTTGGVRVVAKIPDGRATTKEEAPMNEPIDEERAAIIASAKEAADAGK